MTAALENLPVIPSDVPSSKGPKYTFRMPLRSRILPTDPESITLKLLTLEEELQGNKLVESSKNLLEKVALALVAVNGRAVNWASGSVDTLVGSWSPPCRQLLIAAYTSIHLPNDEDTTSFLATVMTEL